jgi:hypothetical protein
MPRSSTARSPPTDSDTIDVPSWDTSPNTFPVYYQALLKWLQKLEPKFTFLVAYYYVLDKSRLACASDNHCARLKAGSLAKGSFANPTYVSASASGTALGGTAPSTGTPIQLPATAERYYSNIELVNTVDMELFNALVATVLDDDTVEEYATAYARSGVLLLKQFATLNTNNNSSSNYAQSIVARMDAAEAVGLASASVAEFNTFKSTLSAIRKLLPPEVPCTDISTYRHGTPVPTHSQSTIRRYSSGCRSWNRSSHSHWEEVPSYGGK